MDTNLELASSIKENTTVYDSSASIYGNDDTSDVAQGLSTKGGHMVDENPNIVCTPQQFPLRHYEPNKRDNVQVESDVLIKDEIHDIVAVNGTVTEETHQGDNRRPVRKRFIPVKFRDGNNGEQNNEVRRDKKKKVSSSSAYHGRSTKAFQEKYCNYTSNLQHTTKGEETNCLPESRSSEREEKEMWYKCLDCNILLSRKSHLTCHVRNHLKIDCNIVLSRQTLKTCHVSHQLEKRFSSLVEHQEEKCEKTIIECDICGKSINRERYQEHCEIQHWEKAYACQYCQKRFALKRYLRVHERYHFPESQFSCRFCDVKCVTQASLRRHEKLHTGSKAHTCSICQASFSFKWDLKSHERTHTGEKPYECTDCHEKFAKRSNLARHQKTHTKEKPYECLYCQKRFAVKFNLIVHQRIHEGVKPYMCNICSKQFNYSSSLKNHEKICSNKNSENKETCDVKNKTERKVRRKKKCTIIREIDTDNRDPGTCDSVDINENEKTHTAEKPFECLVCFKRFCKKYNLENHQKKRHGGVKPLMCRTHTFEKHFECSICSKRFLSKYLLKVHCRTHEDSSVRKRMWCDSCGKTFFSKFGLKKHKEKKNCYSVTLHAANGNNVEIPETTESANAVRSIEIPETTELENAIFRASEIAGSEDLAIATPVTGLENAPFEIRETTELEGFTIEIPETRESEIVPFECPETEESENVTIEIQGATESEIQTELEGFTIEIPETIESGIVPFEVPETAESENVTIEIPGTGESETLFVIYFDNMP